MFIKTMMLGLFMGCNVLNLQVHLVIISEKQKKKKKRKKERKKYAQLKCSPKPPITMKVVNTKVVNFEDPSVHLFHYLIQGKVTSTKTVW